MRSNADRVLDGLKREVEALKAEVAELERGFNGADDNVVLSLPAARAAPPA